MSSVESEPSVASAVNALSDDDTEEELYTASSRKKLLFIAVLAVALVIFMICDFLIGGGSMSASDALSTLFNPSHSRPIGYQIIWDIRLPMTVTAVLVGGALAAAGAQMQTILGNPLAEPYTLGISAAASFSATTIGGTLGMAGAAWIFGIAACGIIIIFSRLRGSGAETMILLGIAIVFFFDAMLALMQYMASEVQLEQVVFWTLGSLTRATWPQIGVLAVLLVICLAGFYRNAWVLTAFRLGDDRAMSMGVNVPRVRIVTLVAVSLLAATSVAMAGTIGFIGLVGPHIARIIVGEDQRYFLTASVLSGSVLLVSASVCAKLIQPGVILPVGIITAVVGVPVFVAIIASSRTQNWS